MSRPIYFCVCSQRARLSPLTALKSVSCTCALLSEEDTIGYQCAICVSLDIESRNWMDSTGIAALHLNLHILLFLCRCDAYWSVYMLTCTQVRSLAHARVPPRVYVNTCLHKTSYCSLTEATLKGWLFPEGGRDGSPHLPGS